MINTKFEAYKLKRELLRSGKTYEFVRNGSNAFGEPVGDAIAIGGLTGLYHEQNSNVQITSSDASQVRTKKLPMILCLYEDIASFSLKTGDYTIINNRKFVVTGIVDVQEWQIVADISLELVDDVTED